MLLNDIVDHLFEHKNPKKQKQAGSKDASPASSGYELYFPEAYFARLKSYAKTKPEYLDFVEDITNKLKTNGRIVGEYKVHQLKHEKLLSSFHDKKVDGWMICWLSRKDEDRLAYCRVDDKTIEIRIGTPKELGYKH